MAFPLFWRALGKAGNSKLAERKALLEVYLSVFGAESIDYLCADREFGGQGFAAWLKEKRIGFVLRIRGDVCLTNARGEFCTARGLFWQEKAGVSCELGRRWVFGKGSLPLFVAGVRLSGGDFVIVIGDRGEDLLFRYKRRWGIETLFGCLKSRGFDLEATHSTDSARLERLFGGLALAFCWAYVSGTWIYEQKPWKEKKHGRLMRSVFRAGLDWLQCLMMPLCGDKTQQEQQKALQFLSCT